MSVLPPFVIAGPTAVGKSGVAVEIAERFHGEIVGADAFQVYRGLEQLTAQPSPELRERVPHHLIGHISPRHSYDVAQWLSEARAVIADIQSRGKRPIVCGGTGLYLRALERGLADLPPADAALRASLEKLPLEELRERLLQIEPDTAVDLKNPRRLIRALEIHHLTGKPPGSFRQQWDSPPSRPTGVCLWRERSELVARISRRCTAMFEQGVLDEVRRLPEGGIGPTAAQTLGLSLVRDCLAGHRTAAQAVTELTVATRRYAKRQMTWFRREPGLIPVELSDEVDPCESIDRLIGET